MRHEREIKNTVEAFVSQLHPKLIGMLLHVYIRFEAFLRERGGKLELTLYQKKQWKKNLKKASYSTDLEYLKIKVSEFQAGRL